MSLRTQYEFLFIGRDEGSFVENYAYDLGEGGERTGKIFINVEVQNNPAEAEIIGETLFDTVRKSFFSDLEKDPYVRFEDALKEVNDALILMREEKVSKYLGNLHVVIAAIVGNNLYLTQCGDSEAYLVRRRFCSIVTEGLTDPQSKDFFSNIASGVLEPGDFVLLSSTRLLRYITKTDLAKISSVHNLVSILSELKDFLATEVLGRIGFVGILASAETVQFSSQQKDKVIAHLEKEEEYEKDGIEQRTVTTVTSTDVSKKASALFSSAKNYLKTYQDRIGQTRGRGSKGSLSQILNLGNWTRDKLLAAFVVIVLVLCGGVWWLKSRSAAQEAVIRDATELAEIREEINSAQSTALINPGGAGTLLADAQARATKIYNSGSNRNKASELLTSIETMRDKIDGVVHVEPKVLADLTQKRSNVSATGLVTLKNNSNTNLFAFEYNALYPVLLDKLQDILTIDDTESVIAAATYEDKASILFYTKAGKVIEFKDNHMSFISAAEGSYHKGIAIESYGSKFYILDPEGDQIWRYTRRRDTFDTAEKYNLGADLKKAVSFAIDSNIYVLNSDGSILKFNSGNKVDLPIKKGPVIAMATPTKIFTQPDMNQIYILEPAQNRILVYLKDDTLKGLVYTSQYVFENLKDVRDFYVDKDGKNLYLLDATKIYKVSVP